MLFLCCLWAIEQVWSHRIRRCHRSWLPDIGLHCLHCYYIAAVQYSAVNLSPNALWSGSILSRNIYRSRIHVPHPEICTQKSCIFSCSSLNEVKSEHQYGVLYSYTCMLKDRYTGFTRWYLLFQWNLLNQAHFCARASLSLWLTNLRDEILCCIGLLKVSPRTSSCSIS